MMNWFYPKNVFQTDNYPRVGQNLWGLLWGR
jgi:hypothetical protein